MKLFMTITLALSILSAESFTLKSDTMSGQLVKKQEFSGFGCDGQNISPELHWVDAPKETKSFAVTVYDPDAPTGSGWWHWIVYNIPSKTTSLPEDFGNITKPSTLKIVQALTDYGTTGYGGACPPKGDRPHRYIFTIHALNVDHLDIDAKASPALVGYMINSHSIAKATLVSYYGR
ncbi:MAG: phosphatidylethanolamine-binding protein [Sulfurovum sp. 39-42-12]|nr:MAG: phosphatidylethanolamine-binding protein [Sulfurovum sp. 35-42-20]OYZ24561.1 MAG: phosphatidylethanolamine-binding protein [Sulfurovum sp. 16-42-52]OYZ48771.1 MAG: phosphatidylethanolamine-binding protein [Sulfurovum sp. 24-42-9]OZA44614.1 MAG: phosphatidylethanolamine-binding protein [Sulfurovum sp. 17-42-90]OZA60679.1 MAG: phosphatidylethanolamine-binding protein [Sulfurovum sp. 39-42-12]